MLFRSGKLLIASVRRTEEFVFFLVVQGGSLMWSACLVGLGWPLGAPPVASLGACPICPLYHIRSFYIRFSLKGARRDFRMLKRSPHLSVTHYKILLHVTS